MPSVRSTTARRSPRAAQRSSENQYGPIMVHALESVRRSLTLVGPTDGLGWGAPRPWPLRPWRLPMDELRRPSSPCRLLSTSRHRRLRLLRLRPVATELRQGDTTASSPRSGPPKGIRLKHLVAMIQGEIPRNDLTGLAGNTREGCEGSGRAGPGTIARERGAPDREPGVR